MKSLLYNCVQKEVHILRSRARLCPYTCSSNNYQSSGRHSQNAAVNNCCTLSLCSCILNEWTNKLQSYMTTNYTLPRPKRKPHKECPLINTHKNIHGNTNIKKHYCIKSPLCPGWCPGWCPGRPLHWQLRPMVIWAMRHRTPSPGWHLT